ncbi:MAG TPA: hypothetical protein VGM98_11695, partial [Schlesneria sp.]
MVHRKMVIASVGTVGLLGFAIAMNASQIGGSGSAPSHSEAIALNSTNFDDFAVTGKEADAIYGDVILRNGHLAAVIAQPLGTRNANMTTKDVAGALIDLSVRG